MTATSSLARTSPKALLRVTSPQTGQYFTIDTGKAGSLQTAEQMAKLVRTDVIRDVGLQRFAAQILTNSGLDSHSNKRDIATAIYRYVVGLDYINDPAGAFDSIQSARVTIHNGFGDCDDLSVLLATLLALVGLRPSFVLAKYKPQTKGFDHVYVEVNLTPVQGGRLALDPSIRTRGAGWESSRAIERVSFPVFGKGQQPFGALGAGVATSAALTGATVGLNFVPVVGPILSALVGPIAGLFSRTEQRTEEAARDQYKNATIEGLTRIQQAVDNCQITKAEGAQAGRELVNAMYAACDANFAKSSVRQSCRNFETQDFPGGAQEGAFATHLKSIASAGGSCGSASQSAATTTSAGVSGGLSGSSSLPVLLLVAAGAYLLLKK